jgi:uncharacterized protein YggE
MNQTTMTTRSRIWPGAAALMLLAVASLGIACQGKTAITLTPNDQSGIAVTGTGKVSVTPDVGEIQLGAQVTQPTVQQARDQAAKAMDAIRGALKQQGVEDKDIATSGFYIQPQYNYRPDGGAPTISGYMVNNTVTVKVRKVDTLSRVLDAAVTAGGDAVRVNSVQFTVDDPEKYTDEARKAAVENARAHADQLAKAAGVSLGKARSMSESSGSVPRPIAVAAPASGKGGAAETAVSPGETSVSVTVSVVYDIE